VRLASIIVPVYNNELASGVVWENLIEAMGNSGPLQVFLLLSVTLVQVSKTIWDLLSIYRFQDLDVVLITIGCLVAALGLLADLIVLQGRKD
jgi:hypothetical protein